MRKTRRNPSPSGPTHGTSGAARKSRWDLPIFLLAAATFAAYAQVLHFGFVNYDDPSYLAQNPHVRGGLTADGIAWAFTHSFAGNWFPLTWISHMLDCQLFGLDAGLHHLTNLCFHVLAAILLYVVLRRITGARWPSAMVAALFALHPLHVESVAWIAERKDVLSACLWMATLAAYAGYIARPGKARYALTLVVFSLGLMAKPMLVTLPLVLFLLDYWPFARGLHFREKLPFLALSAAVSVVTYLVHRDVAAVISLHALPLSLRVENAIVSYAIYIAKMFWPRRLAVFYPYPSGGLATPAIAAAAALAAITAAAIWSARRRPYFIVGWMWYLLTLAPVIGLIQAGQQARADRYTYIPMVGLTIALIWIAADILQSRPRVAAALGSAVCALCVLLTWHQTSYWLDGVSLFQHAVDVTSNNYIAEFNLAGALAGRGDNDEAARHLAEAVRIRPDSELAHAELGQVLARLGRTEDALGELRSAAQEKPDDVNVHYRIGLLLGNAGRPDEASVEFSNAVRLDPNNAEAHRNLGISLALMGRVPEAAGEFSAAVRLHPEDASARFNWGMALANLGQTQQAIAQLSEAVRLDPGNAQARAALEEAMASGGK